MAENHEHGKVILAEPKRLVTHRGAHPDEVVAHYLMRAYLAERYPGLASLPMEIVDNTNKPFEGKDGWQHLAEGTYVLGTGGPGPFNHHPHEEFPNVCTADQMAQAIGVDHLPELEMVLRRTRVDDLNGGGDFVVIADFLRLSNVQTSEEYAAALDWTSRYLELFIEGQKKFHSEAMQREFEKRARIWAAQGKSGEIPVVTIDRSDNEQIAKFARHQVRAEVVIVRNTSGNIAILSWPEGGKKRGRKRVNTFALVGMLRKMEAMTNGEDDPDGDYIHWTQDGMLSGWYFMKKSGLILNGSRTAAVPATTLSLERIEEAVAVAAYCNDGYFPWDNWVEMRQNTPREESINYHRLPR